MFSIPDALDQVSSAIQNAANRVGRNPNEITLVAASKTTTLDQVKEAEKWGVRIFGENRVQEGIAKFLESNFIKSIDALHLIGPLQSNKIKKAVGFFDLIHSVDSLKLAEKINREAERQSIMQSILIEVNIGGEESKNGVSIKETSILVKAIQPLTHLSLLGLMTLPPATENPEEARPYFSTLRHMGNDLGLDRFSMGMSSDFEVAIEEGATWLRLGTALFGRRNH